MFFHIFVKIIKPMKIKITDFAKRHFDPKFGGTKVLNFSVEDFEIHINNEICFVKNPYNKDENISSLTESNVKILNGYAPFCDEWFYDSDNFELTE